MKREFRADICQKKYQDTYYELTPAGVGLCAVLGIGAELLVLLMFGIRFENIPLPVFGFLWLLFGILVSGVLIGLEMLLGTAGGHDYSPAGADAEQNVEPVICMDAWKQIRKEKDLRKVS